MKSVFRLFFPLMLTLPLVIHAAALTNGDIVKMSAAQLDEKIILTTVANSESNYDTSPQGLIDLSTAKVSPTIIAALIKRGSVPLNHETRSDVATTEEGSLPMSPSELVLIDGESTKPMRYLNPQMRTAARGLGFGGIASYAVLRGSAANERLKNTNPAFLVSVPNQAQVESYVTLASFAVRKNNSREVMVGGGYMSYSSGIHPDRIIALKSEKSSDQSRAQKGFTIYKISPKSPLPLGEYAVILYTSEMQGLVSAWFSGTGNSYFDFGIIP